MKTQTSKTLKLAIAAAAALLTPILAGANLQPKDIEIGSRRPTFGRYSLGSVPGITMGRPRSSSPLAHVCLEYERPARNSPLERSST
jgi:hypothetical protein